MVSPTCALTVLPLSPSDNATERDAGAPVVVGRGTAGLDVVVIGAAVGGAVDGTPDVATGVDDVSAGGAGVAGGCEDELPQAASATATASDNRAVLTPPGLHRPSEARQPVPTRVGEPVELQVEQLLEVGEGVGANNRGEGGD